MKIISQFQTTIKEYTIEYKKETYRYTEWIESEGSKLLDSSICYLDGDYLKEELEKELLEKFAGFVEDNS